MSEGLNRIPMMVSVLLGLILSVLPLPHWLNIGRPDFLVIVVLYWSIMVPRAGGLMLAFFAGLLLDAFKGVVLGQNALALCLASYLAIKLHLRVRIFPGPPEVRIEAAAAAGWYLFIRDQAAETLAMDDEKNRAMRSRSTRTSCSPRSAKRAQNSESNRR